MGTGGTRGALALLLGLALGCASIVLAQDVRPLPPMRSWLVDETLSLSMGERDRLKEQLDDLQWRKGSQIAIVLVPTTQPETIEQYSLRLAEAWKLGRKGVDDGILIVVAKDDRRARIEVGYGLEGALPDARVKRILEEQIFPAFQRGEFFRGLDESLQQVIAAIDQESLPAPRAQEPVEEAGEGWFWTFTIAGLILGGVLWIVFYRHGFLRFLASVGAGGGLLALSYYGLHDVFVGVIGAALALLIGLGMGGWWVLELLLSLIGGGGSGGGGGGGGFGGGGASGSW